MNTLPQHFDTERIPEQHALETIITVVYLDEITYKVDINLILSIDLFNFFIIDY